MRTRQTKISFGTRMCERGIGNFKRICSVRSQFILKSIRSHFCQLALIFRSIRIQQYFLRSIRPHLVNSFSSWSIRSRFGQFVFTLNSINFEGKKERKIEERRKERKTEERKKNFQRSNSRWYAIANPHAVSRL